MAVMNDEDFMEIFEKLPFEEKTIEFKQTEDGQEYVDLRTLLIHYGRAVERKALWNV
jgi:hypothetical protein